MGQPGTGLAAEGEADQALGLGKAGRGARGGINETRKALTKDALGAVRLRATEAADEQPKSGQTAVRGQISQGPGVMAVDTFGGCTTARASGGGNRRGDRDNEE